jgi:hypothetical protein
LIVILWSNPHTENSVAFSDINAAMINDNNLVNFYNIYRTLSHIVFVY